MSDDIIIEIPTEVINIEIPTEVITIEMTPEGKDGRSIMPKGEWSDNESYHSLDLVSFQGSSYIALKTVPAGILPTDTEFWMINASPPLLPIYDGVYSILPSSTTQILRTTGMVMEDDVTVTEIPYSETSNLSNGYTATIG